MVRRSTHRARRRALAWAIPLVVGACRGRAAPAPGATSGTPTTEAPTAGPSDTGTAPATLPTSLDAGLASNHELVDAGSANDAPVVLVDGARAIVVDRGKITATRPTGEALPLANHLERCGDEKTKLSAALARFLGRAELLDVTIREESEQGWHHSIREIHYILDTSGPTDVVACTFVGTTRDGGEYSSNATSIAIEPSAKKKRAFEILRTTTATSSRRGGASTSNVTRSVDHFELGAGSCTNTTPPNSFVTVRARCQPNDR